MEETNVVAREKARYTDIKGLQIYTSLGRNSARELGEEAGAIRSFKGRRLYDLQKIDSYLAQKGEQHEEG